MNNSDSKIGNIEVVMIILAILLGERFVSLPRVAVDMAGYASILSVFLGGIISLGICYIIAKLSSNFPDKTIIEYSKVILGKVLSKILITGFFLYFTAFGLLFVRRISEFLKEQLLFNTPLEVIIFTLLFVAAFCAVGGIPIYGKASDVFMTMALLGVVFIIALSTASVKIEELYPAFEIESLKSINIWTLGIPTYIGFEIIAFLVPFMKKPKDIKKTTIIALLVTTVFFTLDVLLTIGVIGFTPAKYQLFPVFTLTRSLEIPGTFRVDIVYSALWVLFVYGVLVGYQYLSAVTLSSIVRADSHKVFVILLIPLFYAVSLIPQNLGEIEKWLRFLEKVWLYGIVGSILAIYLVGVVRKKVKIW